MWLLKHRKCDFITELEANSVLTLVATLLKPSWIGICPCGKMQLRKRKVGSRSNSGLEEVTKKGRVPRPAGGNSLAPG